MQTQVNLANIQRVVGWNTTKTADGFQFKVYSLDYQAPTIVHAQGVVSSRAKAVTKAHQYLRYIKAVAAKNAA